MRQKVDTATQETTKALWVIHSVLTGGVFQAISKVKDTKDGIRYIGVMRKLTFKRRVLEKSEIEVFRMKYAVEVEGIAQTEAFAVLAAIKNADPMKTSELIEWLKIKIVL